jgi:hypothetical protein
MVYAKLYPTTLVDEYRKTVRATYLDFHGADSLRAPDAAEWERFSETLELRDMGTHLCALPAGEHCSRGLVCPAAAPASPRRALSRISNACSPATKQRWSAPAARASPPASSPPASSRCSGSAARCAAPATSTTTSPPPSRRPNRSCRRALFLGLGRVDQHVLQPPGRPRQWFRRTRAPRPARRPRPSRPHTAPTRHRPGARPRDRPRTSRCPRSPRRAPGRTAHSRRRARGRAREVAVIAFDAKPRSSQGARTRSRGGTSVDPACPACAGVWASASPSASDASSVR